MNQIVVENKKLQSDTVIIKNFNYKLEEKIVYLAKNQVKGEQYTLLLKQGTRSNMK